LPPFVTPMRMILAEEFSYSPKCSYAGLWSRNPIFAFGLFFCTTFIASSTCFKHSGSFGLQLTTKLCSFSDSTFENAVARSRKEVNTKMNFIVGYCEYFNLKCNESSLRLLHTVVTCYSCLSVRVKNLQSN